MTSIAPVPGTDPLWLGDWLEAILQRAVIVLGTDAPDRRYVSPGEPVADCEQLTVHASNIRTGAGASNELTRPESLPKASLLVVTVAEIQVTVMRCVHTVTVGGQLPDAHDLDDDGRLMARIGQALWYGLVAESVDGSLWPLQVKPVVLWRTCTQVPPQGGIAAWKMTGEVSLT